MHSTDAKAIANIGANILIGTDSSIHHTDAIEIVKIVVRKRAHITVKKEYHHTEMETMAKIGGSNITIKI